jgi:tight adherence protein C
MVLIVSFFFVRRYIINRDMKSRLSMIKGERIRASSFVPNAEEKEDVTFHTLVKKPFEALREINKKAVIDFKVRFEQCGWNPQLAPVIIPLVKFIGVIVFILFFFVINATIHKFNVMPFYVKAVVFLIFVFCGFRSFEYTADIFKYYRYKKIDDSLPMVLDLVMVCTRAGLSLDKSFDRIAQEIGYIMPDMAKELTITSAELSILPERRLALENLTKRVDLPLVHSLSVALAQAEEQGVSIGQTLQVLSQEFNKQKLLEIEAKAGRLPATLTVPMMICSLPVLFIIILGPGISQMIDSGFFAKLGAK